jgi:peroxiredoxin
MISRVNVMNLAKNALRKVPLTLLACLLALVLFGCNAGQPPDSSTPISGDLITIDPNAGINGDAQAVPVGQPAPDFSLPGIDGKTYTLSQFKGDPVVLEFIATWCPHCRDKAKDMNELYDTYHSKGVEIIDINATPKGKDDRSPATSDDLKWFRDTYNVEFPMLFDKTLKSSADYGILGYPSIYVVDKNGNVVYQPPDDHVPSNDEITAILDGLLK